MALLALLAASEVHARRVRVSRVRPVAAESEEDIVDQDGLPQQVQYYAAPDDRADTRSGRVVLLPAADALNGLSPSVYSGRSVTRAQALQPEDAAVYRASPRTLNASPAITSRAHTGKEQHAKASATAETGAPGKVSMCPAARAAAPGRATAYYAMQRWSSCSARPGLHTPVRQHDSTVFCRGRFR